MKKFFVLLIGLLLSVPVWGVVSTEIMPVFRCAFDRKNPNNKYDVRVTVTMAAARYEMDLPSSHPESKKAIYRVGVDRNIKGTGTNGQPLDTVHVIDGHYPANNVMNSLPVGYYRERPSKKLRSLEINDESFYRESKSNATWNYYKITEINGKSTIELAILQGDEEGKSIYVKKSFPCLDIKTDLRPVLENSRITDDTVREYVTEGLALGAGAKSGVMEYYASTGKWPNNNAEAGLASPSSIVGNTVKSVRVGKNGAIAIQYNDKVDNKMLFLIPKDTGGRIEWTCTEGDVPMKYRPASCVK